ncbi:MAG: hypothetical protein ACPL3P_04385, partial [Anaerolineales bacterium]
QWPFEVQNDADSSLPTVFMVEIPADYLEIKEKDATLALNWRFHTREIFTRAFQLGYLVTDFVFLKGDYARGFYILSHGEATL